MITILENNLSFKKDSTDGLKTYPISIDDEKKKIYFRKYSQIREDVLEENLLEIHQIVKLTGDILVVRYANDEYEEGRYKIVKGHPFFEECHLKTISQRSNKTDKKDPLTEDDKMKLLIEFLEENNRLPKNRELYKNFNVGIYYHTIVKWRDVYEKSKEELEKYNSY